ncbi:unnamed protein product [Oreochromis niloticus]|nr:unnamed protein product [Mustela putorius furo]
MPESERPQHTWIPRVIRCIYGIFFILFIVQGIVGCVYFNDCPGEPSIPTIMVISGFISFIWACSWFKNGCRIFCYCLISVLCFIWFVGTVIVYCNYILHDTPENDLKCNKTLHLFAFWCSNMTYILTAVNIFCLISACCNDRMEPFELYNDEDQPLLWS